MGRIRQLDHHLSNKIAAGEVVERPASVVKELVENSIDAQSTVIEIEVLEAGLESIRIIDNGIGFEPDDVLMAFQRHATSKIKDENDLFRIRTLGFRGEALPSIASVSTLEMTTGNGEQEGTRVIFEGGHLKTHESASSRRGTEIVVTNLFVNTPARLKYMKSINTELGNISDVVNRLALAHPEISFRLRHNNRQLLQTNGNSNVQQVLASIYGIATAKKMMPISLESLDYRISGYIVNPEITRASRNYVSLIANGRYIKNYALTKAILQGYHTLLPIGRYPIVLLNIEMDPLLVDVNVHPSKLEVRFSKEHELNALITDGIKQKFHKQTLIPSGFQAPKQRELKATQEKFDLEPQSYQVIESKSYETPMYKNGSPKHMEVDRERETFEQSEDDDKVSQPTSYEPAFIEESVQETRVNDAMIQTSDGEPTSKIEDANYSRVPALYPIGQMHGTYILAQNENGLYIIDQHAAQERIKYEYYREKVGQVTKECQDLLLPLTLEFSSDQYLIIEEHVSNLHEVGVMLEHFGPNSFIVRSHPTWFPKGEEKEVIEEMVEQLLEMKKVDIKKLREEAAIMMSCKGSIKANRHLRNDEIQTLLDTLRKASDPFTCPHGRPIIIHYSTYEMEKMFKRIM